jgi:hypothetical protein
MQRLLKNLLTAAMIGLIATSASFAMAKGGKGGGKGGKGGKSGGHKSGHKSGHSHHDHKPRVRKTSFSHHSHSISHYHVHKWYGHDHYPVGFWFGGNYGVVDTGVVSTGVAVGGIDVEFSKIAQIDAGDPAKNLAPAYRVWFHNNSTVDINQPFDVALLASTDNKLSQGLPYSSVRVDGLAADETTSVDIRLPIAAMSMKTADGQTAPFAYVHTIIDSQKELVETNKANNLSVDSRDDIPTVDTTPAVDAE